MKNKPLFTIIIILLWDLVFIDESDIRLLFFHLVREYDSSAMRLTKIGTGNTENKYKKKEYSIMIYFFEYSFF